MLRSADLILHAGDFCSVEAYEMISEFGELRGVSGNNDASELFRRLPLRRSFRFGKFTAGMIHGHRFDDLTARQAAEREFVGVVSISPSSVTAIRAIVSGTRKRFCSTPDPRHIAVGSPDRRTVSSESTERLTRGCISCRASPRRLYSRGCGAWFFHRTRGICCPGIAFIDRWLRATPQWSRGEEVPCCAKFRLGG